MKPAGCDPFSGGARARSPAPQRMTVQKIAANCGVSKQQLSSPLKRVAKSALQYRQMAQKFRRKLQVAQRKNSSLGKLASKKFMDMADELSISPITKQIVKGEMRNFHRKPKGRRWTLKEKLFGLAMYKRSASGYRFLRSFILLPGISCLKEVLQRVALEPGVCKPFL